MTTRGLMVTLLLAISQASGREPGAVRVEVAAGEQLKVAVHGVFEDGFAKELLAEFDRDWQEQALALFGEPQALVCPVGVVVDAGYEGCMGEYRIFFPGTDREHIIITLRGSPEQVRERLLPHEINHVLLYSRFNGRKLPLWIVEGIAMQFELAFVAKDEKNCSLIAKRHGRPEIGLEKLMKVTSCPRPPSPNYFRIYASSYWTVRCLVARSGMRAFGRFLDEGNRTGDWAGAASSCLHCDGSLIEMQPHIEQYVAAHRLTPTR